MTSTSPRLRADLQATPFEDADGVQYFDVSDPKTGSVLRLFDFEWALAQRLDGQHNFDELVQFTEQQLGFATSSDDLTVYAQRLHELGLIDLAPVSTGAARPAILPPPPVVERQPEPKISPAAAISDDDGVMGRPVISLPSARVQPTAKAAPPTESKLGKPVPEPAPGSQLATPAKPVVEAPPAKPAEPVEVAKPQITRSPLQEALAGLPEPPAVEEAAPQAKAAPAALSGAPTALLEPIVPGSLKTGPIEPVASPSAATPVTKPAEAAPLTSQSTPVTPAAKPAAEPITLPLGAKPAGGEAKPAETVSKPAAAPLAVPPTSEGRGSSSWIYLVLLLVAVVGAAYYFLVYEPKLHPPALGVQISVAQPADIARTFPTPAEVKKAEPQMLKVDSDGVVAKVAAENDEVAADAPLVVFEARAKLEKELEDLKVKIDQAQKKLETAKGKAKTDGQAKIDEKQARVGEIESLLKKTQLVASRPGTVSKVLVKVGQAVTAGTEALSVADKALAAELKVSNLDAQGMKAGQEVKLSGGAAPITAQLINLKVDGDQTLLQIGLPLDAAAKAGDKLNLQRDILEKAIQVPASALVEGNKVYVVHEGKATLHPVTVADRAGEQALVQGLSSGDQIIVNHIAELHEGTAVQVAPSAPVTPTDPVAAPAAPPAAPAAPAAH